MSIDVEKMVTNVETILGKHVDQYKNETDSFAIFCNLIKERKHEFRKIAATKPTDEQHDHIFSIIRQMYDADESIIVGKTYYEVDKILHKVVSRIIGIDTLGMFLIKTGFLVCPFMYWGIYKLTSIHIIVGIFSLLLTTVFLLIFMLYLDLTNSKLRYFIVKS